MAQQTQEGIKRQLLTDRRFFVENLIQIPNKSRLLVPFKFNAAQEQIYQEFWLQNALRGMVLKAGQMGVTSVIMALFLVDTITRPYTTSLVIAHDEKITQRLLEKADIFESTIPEGLKPKMSHSSTYELAWEDIHSTFYISSARSFVYGRGERYDNVLCSEIAFWENPEAKIEALKERVPLKTGRMLFETTPNGEDNFAHSEWLKAKSTWKAGTGNMKPVFLPWWICEDYQLEPEEGLPVDRIRPLKLLPEEQALVERFGLSEKQIRWRRLKKSSNSLFDQEYAEDDQRCFLQLREAFFPSDVLNQKIMSCYLAPSSFDNAQVWLHPEANHLYVIGADPTVGIHDPAAFTVWDLLGLKLCASFKGVVEPKPFAEKLKLIAKHYNNALLVVENNNPGVAVLGYLTDYGNLFYMRDVNTGIPTRRVGWTTSGQSKSYMLQQFKQLLPQLSIFDAELIREARGFRYNGLAVETSGDDHLMMSAMLALAARNDAPAEPAFQGTWGWKRW